MDVVETRELRYFVAVADELHFGRAAKRLGIAQPALSRAVRLLERRLGVALLVRTSRSVAVTPAGEVLAREGRAALDAVAAAVRATRRAGTPGARVVLAVKSGSDAGVLPALLAEYGRRPGADPVEIVHTGSERLAMLRDGRADAALLHRPNNDLAGLDHLDLVVEPQVVVLAPDHRLAGHASVGLADLRGEAIARWPESASRPGDGGAPLVRDIGSLMRLVGDGRGAAVLPESAVGHVPRALPCIPIRDADPVALVLAWPPRRAAAVAELVAAAERVACPTVSRHTRADRP